MDNRALLSSLEDAEKMSGALRRTRLGAVNAQIEDIQAGMAPPEPTRARILSEVKLAANATLQENTAQNRIRAVFSNMRFLSKFKLESKNKDSQY